MATVAANLPRRGASVVSKMAESTVKTRIFIISDTHSRATGGETSDKHSFCPPFPNADVLLHTGDLTMTGTPMQNRAALKLLASIPAELKLVIAGNHDLSLDREYYLNIRAKSGKLWAESIDRDGYASENADVVHEIWTGVEAKKAGVTYLTEGMHKFGLSNGAEFSVYASPWQPEFYNWAFNYKHNEDRWNPPDLISKEPYLKDSSQKVVPPLRDPHPIPNGANVDIVMTHGPPWMHLDRCYNGYRAGCPQLLQALDRVRPLIHCFGHIHEAWGAERVVWKARTDGNEVQAAPERGKMGEVAEVLGSLEPPLGSPIQKPDGKDVIERGAAYVNVSKASPAPLRAGEETLLINSSIMSLRYAPINAGWLVDLELPIMSPKS